MTEDDGPVDENRNDGSPVDERRGEDGGGPGDEPGNDDPWDEAFSHDANTAEVSPDGAAEDERLPLDRRDLLIGGGVAGALLLGGVVGIDALSGGQGGTGSPTTPTPTVGYGGTTTGTAAGAVGTDTDEPTTTPTATQASTETPTPTPDGAYGGGIGYGEYYYGGSPP